jgi:mevalonate kinase
MAVIVGKAPGKIILFGEHAVVYGQPAIAIPISKVKATARVLPDFSAPSGNIRIQALDIGLDENLYDLDHEHPLAAAVYRTLETLQPENIPAFTLQISSSIPVSAGLGSGAAVAVATIRVVSSFLGKSLPDTVIADLSFEVEKIHHGTPSGIDNNVVTYGKPVFFQRDLPIEFLEINQPTYWIIADTGEKTPTFETVSEVRKRQEADPQKYHKIFSKIGDTTRQAREALINGDLPILGQLIDKNQELLKQLNVSSPGIEHLVQAARDAGAYGAKLSGGGRGGNVIALASPSQIDSITTALIDAGAVNVISTKLSKES